MTISYKYEKITVYNIKSQGNRNAEDGEGEGGGGGELKERSQRSERGMELRC